MKTQVIHLDLQDDLVSVRDKLSWAKTERILLVFPWRPIKISRKLDLRLLQRHAEGLGAQLAIITRRKGLRLAAGELGIPVFTSVSAAQNQEWNTNRVHSRLKHQSHHPDLRKMKLAANPVEAPWRSNFRLRIIIFSLSSVAIMALLLILVPSATIRVNTAGSTQLLKFQLSASQAFKSVNLAGSLPANKVVQVVNRSQTLSTSGSQQVPDAKAAGIVRFRNLTTDEFVIPAGTVVYSQDEIPVKFRTLLEGIMPAAFGKTIDVAVEAVQAGESGNLPVDSLTAIQGSLGTSLAVTNPKATFGGTNRLGTIQTEEDRVRLHETLINAILSDCRTSLPQNLGKEDVPFPDTVQVAQVLDEAYFPAEDQPSENISLTMRVQCQAQYAASEDLAVLARMVLNSILPDGYEPVSNDVIVRTITTPKTDMNGVTRWDLEAQRELLSRPDPLGILSMVLGRRVRVAEANLNQALKLKEPASILTTPKWWPWVPLLPMRISMDLGEK